VCIVCAASVEDCCVAVGKVVGHENIVSASRMNSAIVVFLNDVEKVRKLTQNGIVVNNEMILVSPLSSPAKKVMLSNVPPFISDEAIGKELSRYGRMVSPIKKISLGCKSPLVKQLVSFRRMVFMVFKEGVGELNVVFKFTVDGFNYNIFVSSDTDIKCFKCGQTGHLAWACPERQSDPGVSERTGRDAAESAGVVPPAVGVRPAAEGPGAAAAPDLTESEPQAQPAAQTPTGATPAPEKPRTAELAAAEPRTAELAAAEPRSARPDRKKPWSTEKSSVGSGAVLEPPALTEAGPEVQGNLMETPDTTPVQVDGGDVDMADEPVFKVPNKRKKQGKGQGKKQAKKETKVEEGESDSDDCISDSVLTFDSQEEQINVVYSAEDIKEFLRNTKWQKNVALEEFFPDRKQFIHDVKFFRREGAFVDVEIFRLKKLITREGRPDPAAEKGRPDTPEELVPRLTTVHYCKLFSKALASRLTKVMEWLIHQDQTYCVPDTSIFDNMYLIRDILDVSRLLGLKTGLVFLDQEKAFDRVEHEYLWKVLEAFGFNPGFVAMIRVLYCEIESVLKVNGGLCAPFRVYRGIRQGCSLSGMLYSLAIEPLLNKLRSHLSGFMIW
ncbi:hypothetical protein QTP70_019009, partial [Hemibagrus guttatus]